jgi:hypothetical protein
MRNSNKTLLSIEIYEMNGDEIGKLRKQFAHDRYLEGVLPRFVLNDKGHVYRSDAWLQFVNEGSENFVLFDVATVDKLLSEELSNAGLEDILKNIDLRPILEKMEKLHFEDFLRVLPPAQYLIIQIVYSGGGMWSYDGDFDVDFNLVGVIVGNNLKILDIVDGKFSTTE